MNAGADNFQYLELEIDQKAVPQIQSARPAGDSLPTITYPVQNPTTLASRTSVQIVPVASMKLPCVSRFVATPLLTSQVYREAEVENTSGKLLLGGVAEVYLEERFVGREDMGTVASGERFCVGFGPDENLHSRRELVEKSEQSQGGNRETQVRYRLLLENSAEIPVHVRLLDRVPVAVDSASDILFTLDTSGRPLSEDVEYVRRDRVRGILRWDVEVPARALGKDALAVEYGYRMQFDRNLHLASLSESLSERAWRHESWSNGGHVRRVEDSATGTMLEVVCMPGGNGKAAFANEVRRDLSKKRAIALDVCSLEGTDARVAVGIVTGPGYTWYESKPVSVLPEEWVGVRFDLTQKDWKSMECNWEYSTLPAGLADVRKLVLLVYSEGTQCRLHVDAIRFESLD